MNELKETDHVSAASSMEDQTSVKDDTLSSDNILGNYLRIFKYAANNDLVMNVVATICAIAAGASLPLVTLVFGRFVAGFTDFGTGKSTQNEFKTFTNNFVLWFIYLFVARFIATYIATVCITIAAIRTTRTLRQAFLEATIRQELWFFDKQDDGSVATRITTNANRVHQGIAEKLVLFISALAFFVAAFAVALVAQWKLALITMSVIPAIFLVSGLCVPREAGMEARIVQIYSRAANLAQDVITSIKAVHAFSAQRKMESKYDEHLQEAHTEGKKKSTNFGILFSIQFFCIYSAVALAFWQGFRMYQSGEVKDIGVVFTVALSVVMAATSLSSIVPQLQAVTDAASAASEIFTTIDKVSLLDPLAEEGKQPKVCEGQLEIKNLSFSYPSRPSMTVLENMSLSIPASKTTALVGPSGCGKSTIVGLLERWYVANSGNILLDGQDLSTYNTKWIRSNIRLIQQEPLLFRGSVFQNVANGLVGDQLTFSREQQLSLVVEACKAANAHEFIQNLPNGYDSEVGERGRMLSGGQRQRIAIARSIISKPKILLLDEATSALDPYAEKEVQLGIAEACKNRTVLVIAHKLATIRHADNIAVMANGKVVEEGMHDELMELDGIYSSLVRTQLSSDDKANAETYQNRTEIGEKQVSSCSSRAPSIPSESSEGSQERASETLGYSLIKCLLIIFTEQRGLGVCLLIAAIGCVVEGSTFSAQAVLYSKLLTVSSSLSRESALSQANFYALMFFVVALANMVAYFAMGWTCNFIGQAVTHRYRLELFHQILKQDIEFFDRPENTIGALTSKLTTIPTQLQELISVNILIIFAVLVNVLCSSILAIAFGWKLGCVVVFGGLPLLLFCGYLRIRLETQIDRQNREQFSDSAGLAVEAIASIKTVASLTLEFKVLQEYKHLLQGIALRSIRSTLWTMFWFSLSQSLEFLVIALAFWYGAQLVAAGEYSTFQFYVIFIAVVFGGQAAAKIFGHSTSIKNAIGAANYILWLRTCEPKVRDSDKNQSHSWSTEDGSIMIQDATFRYPRYHDSMVLNGISLEMKPGSFYAVVGPSGCGKSTLISLLERFYDPLSGLIQVGGQDLTSLSPNLYRRQVSLVEQTPTLFEGCIRDNISLGLEYEPSEDEIRRACQRANVWDFISSLPDGLSTACGSQGFQMSGGQRQRIAIARALIRNPRLLLLDEATSALDAQSERLVQASLDEAAANSDLITVAVAQRLSTIRKADSIIVLVDGRIKEMGSHEELMEKRGFYFEMHNAQVMMGSDSS